MDAFHIIFENASLDQELEKLRRDPAAIVVRQRTELGLPIPLHDW